MSYTINLSIKNDDNDILTVVEKTCWYYAGGADWTEQEGHHILSLGASGTSGMLRFRTSAGDSFCLALGVHNYKTWCDIIVDVRDDDTAVKIHPTYYSGKRGTIMWNQAESVEKTTETGRTLAINFFREDGRKLFATLTSKISNTWDEKTIIPHRPRFEERVLEPQGKSNLPQSMRSSANDYQMIRSILSTINESNHILSFVENDITDLWLPLSEEGLPKKLNPSSYKKFKDTQETILPRGVNLENGGHCHLPEDEIEPRGLPKRVAWEGALGTGGFGEVTKVNLGARSYAVKTIKRGTTFEKTAEVMRFFESELRILKKVKGNTHFVQLVGSYTTSKWVGLIMSPVADYNLKEFLGKVEAQRTKGDERLLWTFFGCLSTALWVLHFRLNVRHKDIKPANILVHNGQVFLTDFGMALEWSDIGQTTTKQDNRMTELYCAPEVAKNDFRHSSSDIWSLGCVFLEMITVLKGLTIKSMRAFFENNGTKNVNFWNNPNAVTMWIEQLQGTRDLEFENIPLGWIEKMLQDEQDQRPRAGELMDEISKTPANRALSLAYICVLCKPE